MKATSIPKDKYQAEEERQAKMKPGEIPKIGESIISDTSSSKNKHTKLSTGMTNKRNCFKPITGSTVNNVSESTYRGQSKYRIRNSSFESSYHGEN